MDRPLDDRVKTGRLLRRVSIGGATLAAVVLLLTLGPTWIAPSVTRSRIRTARATTGAIDATISASGLVLPELERVISSPVDARVDRILRRIGDAVKAGDPILTLDTSETALAVEKIAQHVALKANQQGQGALALEKTLAGLDSRVRLETLKLESARAQLARKRKLFKESLVSEEDLKLTEMAEAQAVIELKNLEEEKSYAQRATRAQLEGLALELATLRKEEAEAKRLLTLATPRAERAGVLTWTLAEEGVSIRKGDIVGRIADLGSFRVDATVSDVHARRLSAGMPVHVRVGETSLTGTIATVHPTVDNGAIKLTVSLADRSHRALRANQRVDVLIVTGHKDRVLQIAKGPFADGEGPAQVFVVRDARAVRTPVRIGLVSFETFEIVDGLAEGDEAIVSDMRDYLHMAEVRIR